MFVDIVIMLAENNTQYNNPIIHYIIITNSEYILHVADTSRHSTVPASSTVSYYQDASGKVGQVQLYNSDNY